MSDAPTPTGIAISADQRKKLFEVQHPAYAAHKDSWQTFLDAYDGEGGFLSGDYLVQYPREKQDKYKQRKTQARYQNYSETIVDFYVRKIFSEKIQRESSDEGLTAFWADVTGAGVSMSQFMQELAQKALAAGHAGALCDKTKDAPTGPAKADERARPFLTQYLPTEIQDWRTKDDKTTLTWLKLREGKPSQDIFSDHPTKDDAVRMLVWNDTAWARADKDPEIAVETQDHNLGLVPFAILAPKQSKRYPLTGKSLLGNANVLKALFNRGSEEDEVLRDQAFSMFVVTVPVDGNVEEVRQSIGGEMGTTSAMVVKGNADFVTADMGVPEAIRKNIAYLVQEIYRMAHMSFQRDSLQAESAEAIQLKHDELNATLAGIAEACMAVEKQIARFYFGWVSNTPEAAAAAYANAKVNVVYPTEFFLQDLEKDLKTWVLAVKQELGATMERKIKLRIVNRLEPELDETTQKKVEQEIDAIIAKPKPQIGDITDALRANAAQRLGKFTQQPPPPDPGATA